MQCGRWTVVGEKYSKMVGNYRRYYLPCVCSCGTKRDIDSASFVRGITLSCGCLHKEIMQEKHANAIKKEFQPERFGKLVTTGPMQMEVHGNKGRRRRSSPCVCDCGEHVMVTQYKLESGTKWHCGCLAMDLIKAATTKHGKTDTAEYRIWAGMLSRCLNTNSPCYDGYGGRGIGVFGDWQNDPGQKGTGFPRFLAYMGERPGPEYSIDRIDNDGNYEPGNVRWATIFQQANNKRNNIKLTLDGRTQALSAWAEELGINPNTIKGRRNNGLADHQILCIEKYKRHAR